MIPVPREYQNAIQRYARLAEREARRYGLTGEQLLAKLLAGESGFSMSAVSSAGARGAAQFIPSTRAAYMSQYGVDPWRSVDEAVHAAAIYMGKGGGLAAYNPGGGQAYIDYILGQQVGPVAGRAGAGSLARGPRSSRAPALTSSSSSPGGLFGSEERSGAVRALLWVALMLAGFTLVGLGLGRSLGIRRPGIPIPTPRKVAGD